MDEDVETLVVRVRADTQGLGRDVEAMRASLEGPLASGAERAGLRIEQGLLRAVRTGKFGFEDLKRLALSTLDQIAASSSGRVVYISCNPQSWARDARRLADAGFRLAELRPVGQFRWSTHVELASLFVRV